MFSSINSFGQVLIEKEELIKKEARNHALRMNNGNLNPNTTNYDLQYQRMNITLDPAVYFISGSVTSHFKPNQNMSSIYFDLNNNLTVSQVTYHGNNLNFQQLATKEVKIDFQNAISANVLDSLTIHYSGAPSATNNSFSTGTQNGSAVLATLNEPYGAQDWFPTKQSMDDKIDKFDFKITTPSQYSVAANGKLMSETSLPNSQKLTFWRTQYPMTAYLVALSITNFTKINDTIGNPPFPFVNYLFPTTTSNTAVMQNIDWTKDAMVLFEQYFGTYPFRNEKYGHMQYHYNGVCMEHQTMSSMSSWGKEVIAHELAHQWFGDKVTCGAWNDIWLNEGFATFGEHLVLEKLIYAPSQFLSYLQGQKDYITGSTGGSVYVADANLNNINAIFSSRLSYSKGGYVVRMMKWVLGDSIFYSALQDYHNRPNLAYNYARTSDLQASFLQSTGINFTEFFNDWIYGQGYPTYAITWNNLPNNKIAIKVNQTQSHSSVSFFEMPLPIKVNGTNGEVAYLKLNNTTNNQIFVEDINFTIANIEFNYELQILEKSSTVQKDTTLSTNEVKNEEISLFPNPVTNEIFFKGFSKITPYKIYSIDGQLVKTGLYEPEKSIKISELTKGVYIIKISDKNIKFVKK